MESLEKICKKQREHFDDFEPNDEHFQRFWHKLNKIQLQKRNSTLLSFLKIAAIITFVIFSGIVGYQIRNIQGNYKGLGAISPEYKEVELFYTSNINNQLSMIEKLGSFDQTEHQKILSEELKDMDERYQQLKKELELHPDDDRIIEAMIEYYQVKNSILNRIIEQLYQIRKQTRSTVNASV